MKTRSAKIVLAAAIAVTELSLTWQVHAHGEGEGASSMTAAFATTPGDRSVYEVNTNQRTVGTGDPGRSEQFQTELVALEQGALGSGTSEGIFLTGSLFPASGAGDAGTYWQDAQNGSILEVVDGAGRHYSSTSGGPGGAGLPLVPAYLRPGESARFDYELSFPSNAYPHATGTRIVTMGHAEVLATATGSIEVHRFVLVDSRQTDDANERIESELWFSKGYGLVKVQTTVLAEDGERRTIVTASAGLLPLFAKSIAAAD